MGCMQKVCKNFYAKLNQSISLYHRLSKKAKNYPNLTSESGSNQKFSLLQVCLRTQAACIKPSYRRKGRTKNILKKSENFNSLRPILFEIQGVPKNMGIQ